MSQPGLTPQRSPVTTLVTGLLVFVVKDRVHALGPIGHYTPENGCLAVSFLASISLALGSSFIARAMASLVAS